MFYQQGDVLIICQPEIQGKEFNCDGKVAEGESTGHSHCFENPSNVRFYRKDNSELFIDVMAPSILKHQTHGQIKIPTGKYQIKIVREYDHFSEEIRNVKD